MTDDYYSFADGSSNEFAYRVSVHKYEKERGRTSNLRYLNFFTHVNSKVNRYLIDTPGNKQKSYKVLRALSTADAAVLVLPLVPDIFYEDFDSAESQIKDLLVVTKAMGIRQLAVVFNSMKPITLKEMDEARELRSVYDQMRTKIVDYIKFVGFNVN